MQLTKLEAFAHAKNRKEFFQYITGGFQKLSRVGFSDKEREEFVLLAKTSIEKHTEETFGTKVVEVLINLKNRDLRPTEKLLELLNFILAKRKGDINVLIEMLCLDFVYSRDEINNIVLLNERSMEVGYRGKFMWFLGNTSKTMSFFKSKMTAEQYRRFSSVFKKIILTGKLPHCSISYSVLKQYVGEGATMEEIVEIHLPIIEKFAELTEGRETFIDYAIRICRLLNMDFRRRLYPPVKIKETIIPAILETGISVEDPHNYTLVLAGISFMSTNDYSRAIRNEETEREFGPIKGPRHDSSATLPPHLWRRLVNIAVRSFKNKVDAGAFFYIGTSVGHILNEGTKVELEKMVVVIERAVEQGVGKEIGELIFGPIRIRDSIRTIWFDVHQFEKFRIALINYLYTYPEDLQHLELLRFIIIIPDFDTVKKFLQKLINLPQTNRKRIIAFVFAYTLTAEFVPKLIESVKRNNDFIVEEFTKRCLNLATKPTEAQIRECLGKTFIVSVMRGGGPFAVAFFNYHLPKVVPDSRFLRLWVDSMKGRYYGKESEETVSKLKKEARYVLFIDATLTHLEKVQMFENMQRFLNEGVPPEKEKKIFLVAQLTDRARVAGEVATPEERAALKNTILMNVPWFDTKYETRELDDQDVVMGRKIDKIERDIEELNAEYDKKERELFGKGDIEGVKKLNQQRTEKIRKMYISLGQELWMYYIVERPRGASVNESFDALLDKIFDEDIRI